MADFFTDVRIALRRAIATPGLTVLIVATFALGIGANTAVFSLFDQVLLRSMPVKDPSRLVLLHHTPGPGIGKINSNKRVPEVMSYPMFTQFRDKADVFEGVLAYFPTTVLLGIEGDTQRVNAQLVSGTFFDVLGLKPEVGRLFAKDDDVTPRAHPLVVLSHSLWTRQFGGRADIVGQTVRINSAPMQVIGVAPRGFRGLEVGSDAALYVPTTMKAVVTPTWDDLSNERFMWLTAIARLKPGVTMEQAAARANVLYKQILAEEVKSISSGTESSRARFASKDLILLPGGKGASGFRESTELPFRILLATASLVLFIGCLNIANLLLTRATKRRKEIALRLAIGGSRSRVIRDLVIEASVLAAMGLVAGLAVAQVVGSLLVETLPDPQARQLLSFSLDARVLGFAFGLAALGLIISTVAPALQSTSVNLVPALREGSGASAAGGQKTRQALVIGQIAMSLALLIGASLLARSLFNLANRSVGFKTDRVAMFNVDASLAGLGNEQTHAFLDRAEAELMSQPEVSAVGMSQTPLLSNSTWSAGVRLPGYTAAEDEDMTVLYLFVNRAFFSSLDLSVTQGRNFEISDTSGANPAVIVNQAFAKHYFKDGNVLGQHIGLLDAKGFPFEIVGVVPNFRQLSVNEDPDTRQVFFPNAQVKALGSMEFYVRTRTAEPMALDRIQAAIRRVDPTIPVNDFISMALQRDESIFAERTIAYLASVFGGLALLLAALGLYGVLNHGVTQRFREIGVRVALGAMPGDILGLIFSQAGRLLLTGLAFGIPVAAGLASLVRSQLFGVQAFDPLAIGVAVLVLGASAGLAAYIPAARAARVDPAKTLRCE